MAKKGSAKKKKTSKKKTTGKKKPASKKSQAKKAAVKKSRTGKSKASKAKGAPKKKSKRRGASGLRIKTQHVDFLTYKVDQVRKFYDEILELETETRDTEGLNYLIVTTSESSSIGFMPPHPEMRGEQPLPREPTLYFVVKDVDKAYAQLIAKGAAFMGPPQEMPWGYRVVTTTDPEGRSVMLASKVKKRS
jgi:predicted enzyme related to lactoylglutathione lyase